MGFLDYLIDMGSRLGFAFLGFGMIILSIIILLLATFASVYNMALTVIFGIIGIVLFVLGTFTARYAREKGRVVMGVITTRQVPSRRRR
ncbi:MAG: hypothetical protein E7Z71_07515 [Methanocorpusculum parvum]|nr:hypothetical protein [Methanocorpusculum parvum]